MPAFATELIASQALRPGDTIAVVAPAGPVPLERLAPGLRHLEKHFNLIVADDIGRRDGFLAGPDERRAEEFNAALANPEVRGIWAARGGYGCSRIVANLDGAALVADPKPIIGFSDLTVMLCWAAGLGVRSIHGPVLTQLGELAQDEVTWVIDMLMGGGRDRVLPCRGPEVAVEGRLIGGNLSLLAHLCGTPWEPDYRETLCILEDVGERPYALDRYMTQLLAQNGGTSLRHAAAALLGDFSRCDEPGDSEQDALENIRVRLAGAGVASWSGLASGHGARNWAFPFGARARLESGGLRLLEPATTS